MSVEIKNALVAGQWPAAMADNSVEILSGLAHIVQKVSLDRQEPLETAAPGVFLSEVSTGLLTIRGNVNDASLSNAVQNVLGCSLPAVLQSDTNGQVVSRWMAPDDWLISAPVDNLFQIEQDLRQAVSGSFAAVNVTGGYCVLQLAGDDAIRVLKKSTPYDVHPGNLPPGKVVNSTFAKTQATIRALDEGYELIVRRSFADYVWTWLLVAASEYGFSVTD
ncbi:MAG: sarcosine oxidase subunit gamma family protein [Gammaproteobacteria bacterium]|nr:sarcosine oxidase subunit gamma family protein [Gammaproteobacteria bacterium]